MDDVCSAESEKRFNWFPARHIRPLSLAGRFAGGRWGFREAESTVECLSGHDRAVHVDPLQTPVVDE